MYACLCLDECVTQAVPDRLSASRVLRETASLCLCSDVLPSFVSFALLESRFSKFTFEEHNLIMTFRAYRTMEVPPTLPATGVASDTKPRVLLMGNKRPVTDDDGVMSA